MKQKDNENRKTLVFTVVLGFFVMGTVVYQHLSSPGESTMDDFSIVEQEFVKDNPVSIIDTIEPGEWKSGSITRFALSVDKPSGTVELMALNNVML